MTEYVNFWSHQSRAVNQSTEHTQCLSEWFEVTHSGWEGLALSAPFVMFTFACWCCCRSESSWCELPIAPHQGPCEGEMGR